MKLKKIDVLIRNWWCGILDKRVINKKRRKVRKTSEKSKIWKKTSC